VPEYTPKFAFPSPTLAEAPHGPNNLKALATAVETKLTTLPIIAMGTGSVSFANAAQASAAVTFPVGRFTTAPSCAAILTTTTYVYFVCSVINITPAGCSFWAVYWNRSLVTATLPFLWMAVYAP
jgi:hypothetical protein